MSKGIAAGNGAVKKSISKAIEGVPSAAPHILPSAGPAVKADDLWV